MSPSKKKKTVPHKELPEKEKTLRVSALKYDPKKSNAPVIVAAGTGFVAQNILNVAEKNGIPVYHDDSAATLLSKLEMGQEVPPELFQIVVNIYISLLNLAEGNEFSDKVFK
ncbi:type III secretion protein [Acetobacterium paludosum]|uniref:Type III secretion protein n=1 Tax=Acetobacterium paludosum TaxID=52693 RepID=A0A923HTA5_9FIRM|nr:EscU/YscU/HrcU family type III secretion system export apparatus switch protein [Acetobacterium paludosum]MBC3888248.1 type III secretion protein [Acetobacterium paludosum]